MKKVMFTVAAVVLSAFTMNAQKNADAASVKSATATETVQTKTDADQNQTDADQVKTEAAKPVVKTVQVQDSDAASLKGSSTTVNNATSKPVSKATMMKDEKAEKAAKAKKAVKKDN
jgi:hypothetical protein